LTRTLFTLDSNMAEDPQGRKNYVLCKCRSHDCAALFSTSRLTSLNSASRNGQSTSLKARIRCTIWPCAWLLSTPFAFVWRAHITTSSTRTRASSKTLASLPPYLITTSSATCSIGGRWKYGHRVATKSMPRGTRLPKLVFVYVFKCFDDI
jgi:hypothetical protein